MNIFATDINCTHRYFNKWYQIFVFFHFEVWMISPKLFRGPGFQSGVLVQFVIQKWCPIHWHYEIEINVIYFDDYCQRRVTVNCRFQSMFMVFSLCSKQKVSKWVLTDWEKSEKMRSTKINFMPVNSVMRSLPSTSKSLVYHFQNLTPLKMY